MPIYLGRRRDLSAGGARWHRGSAWLDWSKDTGLWWVLARQHCQGSIHQCNGATTHTHVLRPGRMHALPYSAPAARGPAGVPRGVPDAIAVLPIQPPWRFQPHSGGDRAAVQRSADGVACAEAAARAGWGPARCGPAVITALKLPRTFLRVPGRTRAREDGTLYPSSEPRDHCVTNRIIHM